MVSRGYCLVWRVLFRCLNPVLNSSGRAAFWVNWALVLLVICLSLIALYLTIGIPDRRQVQDVSREEIQAAHSDQRYRIPVPATDTVHPGLQPANAGPGQERPHKGSGGPVPVNMAKSLPLHERGDDMARAPGPEDQPRPPKTVKRGIEDTEKGRALIVAKDADGRPATDPKSGNRALAETGQPQTESEQRPSLQGKSTPLSEGEDRGERRFVRVRAINVREGPSTRSRVKFRMVMGEALTVTGKRKGWMAVRLEDGRSGWVYHTLLQDTPVQGMRTAHNGREIRAVRVDLAGGDTIRVVFELNGRFPPRIMVIKGDKPRVVCDFPDTKLAPHIGDSVEVNEGILKKIRTGLHTGPESKVRVVLDLLPGQDYEVNPAPSDKENRYILRVSAKQ